MYIDESPMATDMTNNSGLQLVGPIDPINAEEPEPAPPHAYPHPLVVEAPNFCRAGDMTNTLAALDKRLKACDAQLRDYV
jgi:hypothetical protein